MESSISLNFTHSQLGVTLIPPACPLEPAFSALEAARSALRFLPTLQRDKETELGGEVDVFPAMDVTVYPPPPQPLAAPDHTRLGQISYPDPGFGTNKVRREGKEVPVVRK